jgi:hypothetical protein
MAATDLDPVSALGRVPGLRVLSVEAASPHEAINLVVRVEVGRTPLVLGIDTRPALDPRSVGTAVGRVGVVARPVLPVVAAPYVPPAIRRRLESAGVGWLDAFGNAHIEEPNGGVFVHIERPVPRGSVPRARGRLFGPASARIAQALLERTEPQDLATLADATLVRALSTVSRALARFEEEGLVRRESGGWSAPDPAALLDAWLEAMLRMPGPGIRGFFTQEPRSRVLERLDSVQRDGEIELLFTGAFAAERLVPLLPADTVDAYVFPPMKASIVGEHRLGWTPSEKRPVVRFLMATGDAPRVGSGERRGLRMVGRTQLVLDLHREGGRALEVASELRREWGL